MNKTKIFSISLIIESLVLLVIGYLVARDFSELQQLLTAFKLLCCYMCLSLVTALVIDSKK